MLQHEVNTPYAEDEMKKMLNVMVVDDDRDTLNGLQYALSSCGHQVTVCENGSQAMLSAMMNDFDCIVTDFNMPGMNGLELTKRLRDRFPLAVIIGISAKDLTQSFLLAGANDFLQKPFAAEELAAIIAGDDILA